MQRKGKLSALNELGTAEQRLGHCKLLTQYLSIIHAEGLQMSWRNWWFCCTWCMHYVVDVLFCYSAACWI